MVSAAPFTTIPLIIILFIFGCLTFYYRRANRKVRCARMLACVCGGGLEGGWGGPVLVSRESCFVVLWRNVRGRHSVRRRAVHSTTTIPPGGAVLWWEGAGAAPGRHVPLPHPGPDRGNAAGRQQHSSVRGGGRGRGRERGGVQRRGVCLFVRGDVETTADTLAHATHVHLRLRACTHPPACELTVQSGWRTHGLVPTHTRDGEAKREGGSLLARAAHSHAVHPHTHAHARTHTHTPARTSWRAAPPAPPALPQAMCVAQAHALVDTNSRAIYAYNSLQRWFGLRMELLGACTLFCVAAISWGGRGYISSSVAGLVLIWGMVRPSAGARAKQGAAWACSGGSDVAVAVPPPPFPHPAPRT
jgi:hypothetical protein